MMHVKVEPKKEGSPKCEWEEYSRHVSEMFLHLE